MKFVILASLFVVSAAQAVPRPFPKTCGLLQVRAAHCITAPCPVFHSLKVFDGAGGVSKVISLYALTPETRAQLERIPNGAPVCAFGSVTNDNGALSMGVMSLQRMSIL